MLIFAVLFELENDLGEIETSFVFFIADIYHKKLCLFAYVYIILNWHDPVIISTSEPFLGKKNPEVLGSKNFLKCHGLS